MKTTHIYNIIRCGARAASALLLAAGCADSLEPAADTAQNGPGRPIVLAVSDGGFASDDTPAYAPTRGDNGTGHNEAGTRLQQGEQFNVWFKSGATVDNATYQVAATVDATSATAKARATAVAGDAQGMPYFQTGSTQVEMFAYYPVMQPMAPGSFTVQQQQNNNSSTTINGYQLSDLMYGCNPADEAQPATLSANGTGNPICFRHRMAMVTLYLRNAGTLQLTSADVVGGACRTVNLKDPSTLTPGTRLTDAVSESAPINFWSGTYAGGQTAYGWHASVLLPPQRLCQQSTAGRETTFMRLTYGGQYVYLQMEPKTIESGKRYCIYLMLQDWMAGRTLSLGDWDGRGTVRVSEDTPSLNASGFYTVGGTTFRMRPVKGCTDRVFTFTSGSTASPGTATASLSDYWIGETLVTQALWQSVMGTLPAQPSNGTGADYPVVNISWNNIRSAGGFLDKLNAATESQRPAGYVFALPSDLQWQWAAEGGVLSQGYTYPGSNDYHDVAWTQNTLNGGTPTTDEQRGTSRGHIEPVALKRPNELGLYDMAGNVQEFLADYSSTITSGASLGLDYVQTAGSSFLRRSGSFNNSVTYQNVHYRHLSDGTYTPTFTSNHLGFRVVLVRYNYGYTGTVQTFTAPATGYYKIECWGAQGGDADPSSGYPSGMGRADFLGGRGGYSSGYVYRQAGQQLYVYVGGQGGNYDAGGYNGGGGRATSTANTLFRSGGGATHVATTSRADLAAFDSYRGEVLIVAGGGGGANNYQYSDNRAYSPRNQEGGYGGGETGGDGGNYLHNNENLNGTQAASSDTNPEGYPDNLLPPTGGTQTGGGLTYRLSSSTAQHTSTCFGGTGGSFGKGGDAHANYGSGGGGGYFGGGGGGYSHSLVSSGGGGSSYVGGVVSGSTTAGNASMPAPAGGTETGHSGNGFVRISWHGTSAP